MCVDSSEHCMDYNKHLVLGTPKLTAISLGRASPKMKQMLTFAILWLKVKFLL